VPEDNLKRLGFLLLDKGTSAELKAVARALEQGHAGGEFEHVLLVVAHFRASEMDLMREQYRLAQPALQRGTPEIADWSKIVSAVKTGKSGAPAFVHDK
jgi:hypothetical protein